MKGITTEGHDTTFSQHLFTSIVLNGYLVAIVAMILYLFYYFSNNAFKWIPMTKERDVLREQMEKTRRPLKFLMRILMEWFGNGYVRIVMLVMFICGLNVLSWILALSCIMSTALIFYLKSSISIVYGKRNNQGKMSVTEKELFHTELARLSFILGADISIMEDGLFNLLDVLSYERYKQKSENKTQSSEKFSVTCIGLGNGWLTEMLIQEYDKFSHVTCIDTDKEAIENCKKRFETSSKLDMLSFVHQDSHITNALPQSDFVICQMEYLSNRDGKELSQFINKCLSASRYGLILGDFERSALVHGLCGNSIFQTSHTVSEWKNLLANAGISPNDYVITWRFGRVTIAIHPNNKTKEE